jgi:hypothetical protein
MTDERDPKVSRRYRDLPGEEPSRELDQAILAAAHRAGDKPHAPLVVPAGRHRWYFSLAAAAVLVLAVAVTLNVERQQPDAELAVRPAPAPAPQQQKAQPAPPAASPRPASPSAGAAADSAATRSEAQTPARRAEEARVAAESANAQAEAKAAEARKDRPASEVAAGRAAPLPRSSSTPMAAQYAAIPPERELERIAEMRRQGRDEEADKALAEFRKRYPDYRISQAMLEKVEKKPAR